MKSLRMWMCALVLGWMAAAFAQENGNPFAPDLVLVNARVVTLDAAGSVREALAIRDGKVAAVGRNARSEEHTSELQSH